MRSLRLIPCLRLFVWLLAGLHLGLATVAHADFKTDSAKVIELINQKQYDAALEELRRLTPANQKERNLYGLTAEAWYKKSVEAKETADKIKFLQNSRRNLLHARSIEEKPEDAASLKLLATELRKLGVPLAEIDGPAIGVNPAGTRPLAKGDRVDVQWGGRWYPAHVLEVDGDRYKIHYDGYTAIWDEWVIPARMRSIATGRQIPQTDAAANTKLAAGDRVDIEWKGFWFEGRILEVNGDQYKVHYDGYSAVWDEWVTTDRLRRIATAAEGALPLTKGAVVQVLWGNKWWPAHVLAVDGEKYKIHYDGWSDRWDEWVTAERIRR